MVLPLVLLLAAAPPSSPVEGCKRTQLDPTSQGFECPDGVRATLEQVEGQSPKEALDGVLANSKALIAKLEGLEGWRPGPGVLGLRYHFVGWRGPTANYKAAAAVGGKTHVIHCSFKLEVKEGPERCQQLALFLASPQAPANTRTPPRLHSREPLVPEGCALHLATARSFTLKCQDGSQLRWFDLAETGARDEAKPLEDAQGTLLRQHQRLQPTAESLPCRLEGQPTTCRRVVAGAPSRTLALLGAARLEGTLYMASCFFAKEGTQPPPVCNGVFALGEK